MTIHFGCTICARCCRDLKLPLTVDEAQAWLTAGRRVQVMCEALPWPQEPPQANAYAAYRRERSFAAMSGTLAVRIVAILAGDLQGACPNLLPDLRCGIYASRPLVCGIYPAEINPFLKLRPQHKGCPPEAWDTNRPVLQRDGQLTDPEVAERVARWRALEAREVGIKQRLCGSLDLRQAALAAEGFVLHSPVAARLAAALDVAAADDAAANDTAEVAARHAEDAAQARPWCLISDRPSTLVALRTAGADAAAPGDATPGAFEYLTLSKAASGAAAAVNPGR
jgi:Fe-S-cluster containining protein